MTDDRLSKEEMNALFQETAAGKEGDNVYFHEIEKEALSELFSVAIGSFTTTLSSVFMQDVFVSNVTMQFLHEARFQQEVSLPYVEAAIRYEGAAAGETIIMVNPPDAQDMADIWQVAKGDEGDESVDKSLTSVMTGMMESIHKGLSMASGSSFSGTFTNLQVVSELTNSVLLENVPESVYVDISFELSIGSIMQTVVHHVLPATVAKQISELLVSIEDLQSAEQKETEKANEQEAELQQRSLQQPEQVAEEKEPIDPMASRVKEPEPNIQNVQFTNFSQEDHPYGEQRNLNMLLDIPLQVTVELGRTKRIVKDILELSHGSVLELDKLAGEPVDILINSKLIAKGEVVVIDENFGVRVTDILSAAERLSKLR
ncbi:flagellar motor switch phosphatase FliY [Alkalihalobacillus hwajinpoensis]|uniref:flagellar motor switch phosphatase FliY n=1 Tax=Guptibacillus hwajinpoensis TaxID=208199 RepID=UPI0018832EE7|nr:flagellar motor switch phosphatase FliY [Pseudalkalibacillus hwajinpoensis]MBF0705168.1 flagellar motor switch phosphatase FliY [Pseudalkalibacillus hwajinpoensis]